MTLRMAGIASLLVSLGVGMASNLLFLAAFQFRLDWFFEPTRILGAGPTSAMLLRWAAVLGAPFSVRRVIPVDLLFTCDPHNGHYWSVSEEFRRDLGSEARHDCAARRIRTRRVCPITSYGPGGWPTRLL